LSETDFLSFEDRDGSAPSRKLWSIRVGNVKNNDPSLIEPIAGFVVISLSNFAHELTTALQVGNRFRRTGVGT
jgi:hypothetical protein